MHYILVTHEAGYAPEFAKAYTYDGLEDLIKDVKVAGAVNGPFELYSGSDPHDEHRREDDNDLIVLLRHGKV